MTLVVAGLAAGGAYAMLGVSIVVLHRMAGVVNFSQAAIGAFGAYTTAVLFQRGWPYGPAALAGVGLSVALAISIGLILNRFFAESDSAARTGAIIAVTVGLFAAGFRLFGDTPRTVPAVAPGVSWEVGGVVVTAATVTVLAMALAMVAMAASVLAFTRLGSQVRAISERPVTAELLGVPTTRLTCMVWGFTAFFSTVGMTVVASNLPGSFSSLGFLVFPAVAAALIGAFRSLGLAFAGGITVGVLEAVSNHRPAWSEYRVAVPFLVALVVLLWTQRREIWDVAR